MIHRREYGTPVLPGVNLSGNEHYADVWFSTRWFSLNLRWDKAKRRPIIKTHRKFAFRPIGPWRRIADLEAAASKHELEQRALNYALHLANERYDKIRDANAQLRETLTLYRNA